MIFSRELKNTSLLWVVMWIIDLYFTSLSMDIIHSMPCILKTSMHKLIFWLFLYILLGFEYHPLLPSLVFFFLTCLWDLPSMAHIFSQHWLYLPLIWSSLISCWWIPFDLSFSPLVFLNYCRLSLLTWSSLFICLWNLLYFTPLLW